MTGVFGYYDAPGQTEPAYCPPEDAPCPVCLKPTGRENISYRDVLIQGDDRSYFLLFHTGCKEDRETIDTFIQAHLDARIAGRV